MQSEGQEEESRAFRYISKNGLEVEWLRLSGIKSMSLCGRESGLNIGDILKVLRGNKFMIQSLEPLLVIKARN